MTKSDSFDRAMSVLVLLVAVGAFGVLLQRQFGASPPSASPMERSARRIVDWKAKSTGAVRPLRRASGTGVVLTVFTDFECPFCRRLDSLILDYSAKSPHGVTLQLVHLPLGMHLNAVPAAHAFECALMQGAVESFVHAVYERQEVLGQVVWDSVAAAAGVPSLSSFNACMRAPIPEAVQAGTRLARELGISITPTVVVNDWLITPADPEFVFQAIEAVAAGRSPKL